MKTRCPHCQTLFKITNEQLKIHSGQVRCGNCKKLFNAFDALSQVEIDEINNETNEANKEINVAVNKKTTPKLSEVSENKSKEKPKKISKVSKENKAKVNAEIKKADDKELEQIQHSLEKIDALLDENYSDSKDQQQDSNLNQNSDKVEPKIIDKDETANIISDEISNVKTEKIPESIIKEKSPDFWLEKTLPSWFSLAIISLLSLFLILQIFVHFRNEISQTFPAFRSVYNALNLSLASNSKNIEQITIEASDLNNIDNNNNSTQKTILKLKIMLGNRANFNQNWPLIELNLTDTLDQSLAKYTFAPQDYLDHLIYQNVAKELENNNINKAANNNNDDYLKETYKQEELLYKQYKQKLKYFQAHSEQTIELYIETKNINAAGYKLAVGYL